MKVVINTDYGGFGLSPEAYQWLREHGCPHINKEVEYWEGDDESRADPLLVQVVEQMGEKASGELADLDIVEIPDDVNWELDEYDGFESIHEVHRSW